MEDCNSGKTNGDHLHIEFWLVFRSYI